MFVLGLTGGSGSGKSRLAAIFVQNGATVLDADAIYHAITDSPSRCTEELATAFGADILTPIGALNRPALAALVFSGENRDEKLAALNAITHRYVREEFDRLIAMHRENGTSFLVLDVPLLFEANMDTLCDATVAVLADREVRLARITARDGIDRSKAEARINAQPTDEFYRTHASAVICNNRDEAALSEEAARLLKKLSITGIPEQK